MYGRLKFNNFDSIASFLFFCISYAIKAQDLHKLTSAAPCLPAISVSACFLCLARPASISGSNTQLYIHLMFGNTQCYTQLYIHLMLSNAQCYTLCRKYSAIQCSVQYSALPSLVILNHT